MPKPGRIKIYTSGWPKNQKRCWKRTGSPPPAGSKNVVFILRSVNNIVIAPARTGKDNKRRIAVIKIAHKKSDICSGNILGLRKFIIVVIKLSAPKIEDTPAR